MMAEIETAVNPDSVIGDWHIFLGIDRPMPRQGDRLTIRCGIHEQRKAQLELAEGNSEG